MSDMTIPRIETERTFLRAFNNNDLDDLAAIFSDADVMRFMPGGKPRSREQTLNSLNSIQKHWDEHGFGWWAVVIDKLEQKLAGWCGLARLENTTQVELLYMFDKPYWGKGLATETAKASLRYGFEELNLKQIVALSVPENTASRRVMEKLGMNYEGLRHFHNSDLAYYSIDKDKFEWPESLYKVLRD